MDVNEAVDEHEDDYSSSASSWDTVGRPKRNQLPPSLATAASALLSQALQCRAPTPISAARPLSASLSRIQSRERPIGIRLNGSNAVRSPSPTRRQGQAKYFSQPFSNTTNDSRHSTQRTSSSESYLTYESSPASYVTTELGKSFSNSGGDPLELGWSALATKRDEVQQKRAEVWDARQRLKKKRELKDAADNAFMALLRPLLLEDQQNMLHAFSDTLQARFRDLQSTRDEYHELEVAFESLEDSLTEVEIDLEQLERRFLRNFFQWTRPAESRVTDEDPREDETPPSRTSLLGIPSTRPNDRHPLYKEFMKTIGKLELAQEHLEDLMLHKAAINLEQENLRRSGDQQSPHEVTSPTPKISDADLLFLRDYEEEVGEARAMVDEWTARVEEMKQMCLEKDIIPKNAPFQEIYSFQPDIGDDMSISFGADDEDTVHEITLSHPRFPLLMSNPSHLLQEMPLTVKGALKKAVRMPMQDLARKSAIDMAKKEFSIEDLIWNSDQENKSDFINRWLLHRLRTTPLEAELLMNVFRPWSHLDILDVDHWQADVLYHWPRDSANVPPETFVGLLTSETSGVRLRSPAVSEGAGDRGVDKAVSMPRDSSQSDPG